MSGRVLWVVGFAVTLLAGCVGGTDGEFVANLGPVFVDLDDDPEIQHTFNVHNDSAKPLEIVGVRTSCNCAKAELSATQIAPGRSATLTLTYVPSKVWGSDTVSADLLLRSGSVRRYTLHLSWYPRLFVHTTDLDVGGVRSGLAGGVTLRCRAYGPSKESVYRFASAESDVGLTCSLAKDTGKYISPVVYESRQELRVSVPPSTKLGDRRGTLRLTFRDGNGQTICTSVTVRWEVTPVVQPAPAVAVLEPGGELSVTLQAHDGLPFEILGFSIQPPEAQAWLGVEIDRQARRVLLRDRRQSETVSSPLPQRCLVAIEINHPNQKVVQLPVLR